MMTRFFRFLVYGFSILFIVALASGAAAAYAFWYYGRDLPDYRQLANYQPKIATRVHAGDGRLITEFATENRAFVPIESIPRRVVQAFVAAEDQRFYQHKGVDPVAIGRAVVTNLENIARGRRMVGGSTITQQVAKNFLVGDERRLERKIREAIIAVLKTVYDPEIPVDIYELGLIYEVDVEDTGDVHVVMTLTSPMCPVAETLPPEVEAKVRNVAGVTDVQLELVWEPTWSMDMMSEAARLELNL